MASASPASYGARGRANLPRAGGYVRGFCHEHSCRATGQSVMRSLWIGVLDVSHLSIVIGVERLRVFSRFAAGVRPGISIPVRQSTELRQREFAAASDGGLRDLMGHCFVWRIGRADRCSLSGTARRQPALRASHVFRRSGSHPRVGPSPHALDRLDAEHVSACSLRSGAHEHSGRRCADSIREPDYRFQPQIDYRRFGAFCSSVSRSGACTFAMFRSASPLAGPVPLEPATTLSTSPQGFLVTERQHIRRLSQCATGAVHRSGFRRVHSVFFHRSVAAIGRSAADESAFPRGGEQPIYSALR